MKNKDKYLEVKLAEIEPILDKIYQDGFEDGANEGQERREVATNIQKAIKAVVDYLEHDEKRDYEQHNTPPKNHIWHSIKLLKEAIR